jgi:hypothetical protein
MEKLLVVRFPKEQVSALNTYLACQKRLPRDVKEAFRTLRNSAEEEESIDWGKYDYSQLITRIHGLSQHMRFIAIGYLVNKALREDNCGISQQDNKRQLVERAIDLGLIHTELVDGDSSPHKITSIRLNEEHPEVRKVLDSLPDPN